MIPVYLEVGPKRVFAGSFDWPGWGRFEKGFGKGPEAALEALTAYAPRFALIADEAGLTFPKKIEFDVVERVTGGGGTEFGIPEKVTERDTEPVGKREAERMAALVTAAWRVFDRVAAKAPAELRKGPRGGGRDRDKMIAHVIGAEFGYARQLDITRKASEPYDPAEVAALRDEMLAVLRRPSDGSPVKPKGWPTRYAARRIAWHVLDHLWEMEDRS
jgi:hypothetical protein